MSGQKTELRESYNLYKIVVQKLAGTSWYFQQVFFVSLPIGRVAGISASVTCYAILILILTICAFIRFKIRKAKNHDVVSNWLIAQMPKQWILKFIDVSYVTTTFNKPPKLCYFLLVLAQLQHKNLVRLQGAKEMLLVYEYIMNGSHDNFLLVFPCLIFTHISMN